MIIILFITTYSITKPSKQQQIITPSYNIKPSKSTTQQQTTQNTMQTCLQKLPVHLSQIIQYSGHYIMRVGNYQQCINTQGMDYYSIYFNQLKYSTAPTYVGLCLPKECNNEGLKDVIDGIAVAAGIDIRVGFINSRISQQREQFGWVFWATITIMGVLTALVVLTSLIGKLRQSKLMSSFSLQQSAKIFKYNPKSDLNILNGIRSLSMLYVILGHQYSLIITNTSNILSINQIMYRWQYLLIEAGVLAVDTFFFVGGFLVAYSILKESKMSTLLRYPLAIFNRVFRFLPSYFLAILIYYSVMIHFVTGPFWFQLLDPIRNCQKMWKPLAFVDNLVDNGNSMCMGWGWYLQNDMQMFLASVAILAVYAKSRFWAFVAIFVSIGCSFWYTMQQSYQNQYKYTTHLIDFQKFGDYMSDLYIKPWSRCPPYFYGLLLGMLYVQFLVSEKKTKKNENKNSLNIDDDLNNNKKDHEKHVFLSLKQFLEENVWKRRFLQIIGILILAFVVFIPRTAQGDDQFWSQLAHSLFLTYSKFAFTFGLSLILLPSLLGIPTLARFLLDTKLFNFIAKISFWTYLIHLNVVYIFVTSIKIDFYYAYVPLFSQFAAASVFSMVLGLFFCVICQIPFAGLQKIMMNRLFEHISKKINRKNQQHVHLKANEIRSEDIKQINESVVSLKD